MFDKHCFDVDDIIICRGFISRLLCSRKWCMKCQWRAFLSSSRGHLPDGPWGQPLLVRPYFHFWCKYRADYFDADADGQPKMYWLRQLHFGFLADASPILPPDYADTVGLHFSLFIEMMSADVNDFPVKYFSMFLSSYDLRQRDEIWWADISMRCRWNIFKDDDDIFDELTLLLRWWHFAEMITVHGQPITPPDVPMCSMCFSNIDFVDFRRYASMCFSADAADFL